MQEFFECLLNNLTKGGEWIKAHRVKYRSKRKMNDAKAIIKKHGKPTTQACASYVGLRHSGAKRVRRSTLYFTMQS